MRACLLTYFAIVASIFYPQAGLFLTADDFVNGHLTHCSNTAKIRMHELINRDRISIKNNDSVFTYKKSEVYGFRKKEGCFRLFNGLSYLIINPREKILIYKITTGSGLKNSPIEAHYYISKNAATEILPLSLHSLSKLFSEETKFELLIEVCFKNDDELTLYDTVHHMYKLNRLYDISKIIN